MQGFEQNDDIEFIDCLWTESDMGEAQSHVAGGGGADQCVCGLCAAESPGHLHGGYKSAGGGRLTQASVGESSR